MAVEKDEDWEMIIAINKANVIGDLYKKGVVPMKPN